MRKILLCIFAVLLLIPSAVAIAESGGGEEKLSPFSGSLADSLWTLVTFLVLIFALWKLVWKKMLDSLTARQEYIALQISNADETKKKANDVLADYNGKLANVNDEGMGIIKSHTSKAEKQAKEMIEAAKIDIEQMREKIKTETEHLHRQARQQLVIEAGSMVLELGKEILGREINNEDNQRLIDQAIEKLKQESEE
jgi:F-type H+-transporting ATPase subunit b